MHVPIDFQLLIAGRGRILVPLVEQRIRFRDINVRVEIEVAFGRERQPLPSAVGVKSPSPSTSPTSPRVDHSTGSSRGLPSESVTEAVKRPLKSAGIVAT